MSLMRKYIGVTGRLPSSSVTCEETSNFTMGFHVCCGQPATAQVYHDRDGKTYSMCAAHADHNVRNRGGEYVQEAA